MENIIYKETEKDKGGTFALRNDYIRTPNSLSINALQIFGLALSKIDFKKDNPAMIDVSFTFAEMKQAIGSESNNIEFYKNALLELSHKAFVKIDKGSFFMVSNLTPNAILENGIVTITINNTLRDYILRLANNYTEFKVLNMAKFTSRFSYVLYQNLCSWNDHSLERKDALDERERYYTTKQLKDMFDLPIDAYCTTLKNGKLHFNRKLFEQRVLDFAVEEINKYSNIQVEYRKTYIGKKVDKYIFHWFRRDGFNYSLGINNK